MLRLLGCILPLVDGVVVDVEEFIFEFGEQGFIAAVLRRQNGIYAMPTHHTLVFDFHFEIIHIH